MIAKFLLKCSLALLPFLSVARTIVVQDKTALDKANKEAQPGDVIVLKNGNWNNVSISLNCSGTKENPITFKAEKAGGVIITGSSKLRIGGNFIVVDGWYFTNGYSGSDPVIRFSTDKSNVANDCRVTNTVINEFNNPKRLDENYWIALYGKKNRVDHCTFLGKKNLGVLIAVILEDDRSRENYHLIDHNYFGERPPLASNAGEIIRVGVSQHCEFSSFTQIVDNYFEHCSGETEIISIKSCHNTVRNNVFKECQGGVVLRHGNYNTVRDNIFLGNNQPGTGGVRIINKGQWVVNNLFYKCRGEGFRSPLSIMNGVPNSPANRYVPVSNAVVANNSFFECTPISFCEGSDNERTVPPSKVFFVNNIFYNHTDSLIYNTFDDISGIKFSGNSVSKKVAASLTAGFIKTNLSTKQVANISYPVPPSGNFALSDSLQEASGKRLEEKLPAQSGFADMQLVTKNTNNAFKACGAKWFSSLRKISIEMPLTANCSNAEDIIKLVETNVNRSLIINLTGKAYQFAKPIDLQQHVTFSTTQKTPITLSAKGPYVMQMKAGKHLSFDHVMLDLSGVVATSFITTDTAGSSNHSSFSMTNSTINGMNGNLFFAALSSVADSITINQCNFSGGSGVLFNLMQETDKKGYYNVERMKMTNNRFSKYNGQILAILRSGKDESTMGPLVVFEKNIVNETNGNGKPLLSLTGVQKSFIKNNSFTNSNVGGTTIEYNDEVRADHIFSNNGLVNSGAVSTNKFVISDLKKQEKQ